MTEVKNGTLYRLACIDGYYYIGSTQTSLSQRVGCHRCNTDRLSDKVPYSHFKEIGWDNITVETLWTGRISYTNLKRLEEFTLRSHLENHFCLNARHASSQMTEGEAEIFAHDWIQIQEENRGLRESGVRQYRCSSIEREVSRRKYLKKSKKTERLSC